MSIGNFVLALLLIFAAALLLQNIGTVAPVVARAFLPNAEGYGGDYDTDYSDHGRRNRYGENYGYNNSRHLDGYNYPRYEDRRYRYSIDRCDCNRHLNRYHDYDAY